MSWLGSFLVAVLTSVVAAVAAGLVAGGCVDWYRIPAREGEAGYFFISIVLLGGLAGFVGGLILSRFAGGVGSAGFFKGLGICSGAMLALAGIAATIAWSLADIPPTIGGQELDLLVEVRLPKGAVPPPANSETKAYVFFESLGALGKAPRASQSGDLKVAKARQEDGRWIVPGSVPIFTTRGRRVVTFQLGEGRATGFQVPFPGHPGARYGQWSNWLPASAGPGKPWPDTEMSYRFRVQPQKTYAEIAAEVDREIAALGPDTPLEVWFGYFTNGAEAQRDNTIAKAVGERPADLVKFLRSPESKRYLPALYAVELRETIDPQVAQAVREIAGEIEAELRRLNTLSPQDGEFRSLRDDISLRFGAWMNAWPHVCRAGNLECRAPVETILNLAAVQKDDGSMQSLVGLAKALLANVTQPPAVPQ